MVPVSNRSLAVRLGVQRFAKASLAAIATSASAAAATTATGHFDPWLAGAIFVGGIVQSAALGIEKWATTDDPSSGT